MPLPANAVDNAVAKLDGIADDLMKKSGIPGMAVAVVHGGKTVYAKGFGEGAVEAALGGDFAPDP
jgi:CubicO group peptidase (beta-lactamase class C family)